MKLMNDWDNCKAEPRRQRKCGCLRRSRRLRLPLPFSSPEWTRKGNSATIIIISSFNITPHIVRKIPLFYGGAQNQPDRKWAGSENARVTFSGVDIKGDYCPQAGSSLCVPDTRPLSVIIVCSQLWTSVTGKPFPRHRPTFAITAPEFVLTFLIANGSIPGPLLLAHTAGISLGFLPRQIYAFLAQEKIKKIISTIINATTHYYIILLDILSTRILVSLIWKHYLI